MSLTDRGSKSPGELRKFGLVMSGALAAVTLLLLFRSKPSWPWTGGASLVFLFTGLFLPRILTPVEKYWMLFAGVLGFIMTNVLLTLVFFLGVLPTGLLMRLFGKDPLRKGFDRSLDSYWIDVTEDGPGGRPEKPY